MVTQTLRALVGWTSMGLLRLFKAVSSGRRCLWFSSSRLALGPRWWRRPSRLGRRRSASLLRWLFVPSFVTFFLDRAIVAAALLLLSRATRSRRCLVGCPCRDVLWGSA